MTGIKKWGEIVIWGVAALLIFLLTLSSIASTTNSGTIWYIFWALFVSVLWAEAMYGRNPKRYANPRTRRLFFMAFGVAIVGGVWALYWVSTNLDKIAQILVK